MRCAEPSTTSTRSLDQDQEAWRWGRVHPLVFGHALGEANPLLGWIFNRRLEVGGGQETVAQVGWDPNRPFTAIWAPCWRMVADPVRPERSRWQAFTGQSGHPASNLPTTCKPTGSRAGLSRWPVRGRGG